MDELHSDAWESSYGRRESFCFWPSDEVVRFVSRFLRKRVGWDEVVDVAPCTKGSRALDVGCGIGRHLLFGSSMGLEMYGVDLSQTAVDLAKDVLRKTPGAHSSDDHVYCGDIRSLPWSDGFFDHALSDSVLEA